MNCYEPDGAVIRRSPQGPHQVVMAPESGERCDLASRLRAGYCRPPDSARPWDPGARRRNTRPAPGLSVVGLAEVVPAIHDGERADGVRSVNWKYGWKPPVCHRERVREGKLFHVIQRVPRAADDVLPFDGHLVGIARCGEHSHDQRASRVGECDDVPCAGNVVPQFHPTAPKTRGGGPGLRQRGRSV